MREKKILVSETPLVDAEVKEKGKHQGRDGVYVTAEFARELERELSRSPWVKTSERAPTEKDAFVITRSKLTGLISIELWSTIKPQFCDLWMPIPALPVPEAGEATTASRENPTLKGEWKFGEEPTLVPVCAQEKENAGVEYQIWWVKEQLGFATKNQRPLDEILREAFNAEVASLRARNDELERKLKEFGVETPTPQNLFKLGD